MALNVTGKSHMRVTLLFIIVCSHVQLRCVCVCSFLLGGAPPSPRLIFFLASPDATTGAQARRVLSGHSSGHAFHADPMGTQAVELCLSCILGAC